MAFAIDHRSQLEEMADAAGAPLERLAEVEACWPWRPPARVAAGRPGYGMLLDEKYGREALFAAEHRHSGSAGRSSCRARGRCASSSARTSARSWSNGR